MLLSHGSGGGRAQIRGPGCRGSRESHLPASGPSPLSTNPGGWWRSSGPKLTPEAPRPNTITLGGSGGGRVSTQEFGDANIWGIIQSRVVSDRAPSPQGW